jgi:hypothetical protein
LPSAVGAWSSPVVPQVVVPARFRGPPRSANGGYACGAVARFVGGPAEVTLRSPPPLDVPLDVTADDTGAWVARAGDVVVAEARPASVVVEVPPLPTLDEARAASAAYRGFTDHPFGSCFVCGPNRAVDDGLRIFPGRVASGRVAAPWIPAASACEAGVARLEVVWAALDCPSYFGIADAIDELPFALLGRLSARVDRCPDEGEPCIAIGWSRGVDGRKLYGGSAVATAGGEVLAVALATWIRVPQG